MSRSKIDERFDFVAAKDSILWQQPAVIILLNYFIINKNGNSRTGIIYTTLGIILPSCLHCESD